MITDTQLIAERISSGNQISNTKIIADLISKDRNSAAKQRMYEGVMYYRGKNLDIAEKTYEYYGSGGFKQADTDRSNAKLASGYLALLIDQKTNYLFNDLSIKNLDKSTMDKIDSVVDINQLLKKTAREAAKKSVEWIHPHINSRGEFKLINISGQESIPIWDTQYQNELVSFIRYYQTQVVLETGLEVTRYRVEWWDREKVSYYVEDDNGLFVLDLSLSQNPAYHWAVNSYIQNEKVKSEGHSWGRVPFIPIYNNDTLQTDLEPVKPFIDAYDAILSGLIDNLKDLQDAIVVLSGYPGMESTDIDELVKFLRKYKMIAVDEKGSVDYLKMDIPIDAKDRTLEILEKCIFKFGKGVDMSKLAGSSITNVYIKSMYGNLDLKCNDLEEKVKEALSEVLWFLASFFNLQIPAKLDLVFNRAMIFNKSDIINDAINSMKLVSRETALSMHPDVPDVKAELALIQAESEEDMNKQEAALQMQNRNMPEQQEKMSGDKLQNMNK